MPEFTPVDYDPFSNAVSATAPNFAPPSSTFDQFARGNDIQADRLAWPQAPGEPARVTVGPPRQDLPAYTPSIGTGTPAGPTSAGGRDFAGEITQAFNPVTSRDGAPAPPLPEPREVNTVQTPLAANQRMQAELENPYVMDRLIAMTRAEVSNLGPEGAQKFLETIRNRAAAEGKSLAQVLGDRRYFPAITFARASQPVSAAEREQYAPLVSQAMAGSNTANYATGNASYDPVKQRWVGFQGGPTTATTGRGMGTELYGIEKPNLGWAHSVGYEGGEQAPYEPEEGPWSTRTASRMARGARPVGGRDEGMATRLIESLIPGAAKLAQANQLVRPQMLVRALQEMIGRPKAATEAAGSLQRGGDYDPAPAVATAMGMWAPRTAGLAAGGGAGEAGIFGGRLAKTADHAKLAQAQELKTQGVPADTIRAQTGWHEGPDGQWRFEINDQGAKANNGMGPLDQTLEHPELYEAYPHLRGTESDVTGNWPGKNEGQVRYVDRNGQLTPRVEVAADTPEGRRSTLLHEAQHLVQDHEGFTPGTHPAEFRGAADPYGEYQRTAGEVEARNVTQRRDYSPQERRNIPPDVTEDVLRPQQNVLPVGAGGSRKGSFDEPGQFHTLEDTFAGTGGGERGGQSGRAVGVAEASRAATDAAGSAPALIGLPTKALTIGPDSYYVPGPNSAIHTAAEQYMRSKGLKYEPPQTYAKVDVPRAERIAEAFDQMPHAPDDPKVKASYDAMIKETVDQYRELEKMGIKFEPIPPGMPDPYAASPRLANKDFRDNKHLWYYPTDTGFGTSGADVSGNPLLRMTDIKINGKPLPANDVFRIVHDVFGHFKEGVGFRADGEENAWRSHSAMYSDLARPAMTSETRGQNSWVNYGPNGPKNRSASAADTVYADQKTGLLPDWVMNEGRNDFKPVEHDPFGFEDHPGYISTRLPTAAKATEDPFNSRLTIDFDAMRQQPEVLKHNVGITRRYPIMTSQEARLPVEQAARTFMDKVRDNILWLHDQTPPEIAARSKLWYDGANRIAQYRAQEYGLTPQQTAGVYAALSPQKDWFQNVSLGDRLMDSYFNNPDFKMSKKDMYSLPPKMQADKFKPLRDAIEGRGVHEIGDEHPLAKAFWARSHDELTRSKAHHIITPEGNYENFALKEDGTPWGTGWGSGAEINKALRTIESGGSSDTISRLMGERHKVRSFYNNILHPNAPHGDVTIDTHAVAGGLLQPLGSTAPEVAHNFGNWAGKGVPTTKSSGITGTSGLYGLYADAFREAAKARNLLPRQMQSITWEAGRGLFPEGTKTDVNIDRVKSFWNSHRKGNMTLDDVRNAILENQGGIKPPPWWESE